MEVISDSLLAVFYAKDENLLGRGVYSTQWWHMARMACQVGRGHSEDMPETSQIDI
jgi:hypothetical protein